MSWQKGESRKGLIQKIHIAKGQLGFDDDMYRDFLALHSGGKTSCSDMTVPVLFKVLNAFKDAGFRVKSKKHKKPYATKEKQALMDKIEALLADSGKPWAYAEAVARNMHGKYRLQWCDVGELRAVMIALQKQQRRQ